MKLVQLLAKELKEWPEGVSCMAQDSDGKICTCLNGFPDPYYGDWTICGPTSIDSPVVWADKGSNKQDLAHDQASAIITIEAWQAEREKMNKPKWIRHRGGKCPVKAGTKVVTRYRDGVVSDWCMTRDQDTSEEWLSAVWSHSGGETDIMAYYVEETKDQEIEEVRKFSKDVDMNIGQGEIIHGPVSIGDTVITAAHPKFDTNLGTLTYKLEIDATGANKELDSLVAKWGQIESPLKWRDEIIELEAYEEEFRREREKLIRKLESEGFKLMDHMTPVYGEKIIDISDWRKWKEGDIVAVGGLFGEYPPHNFGGVCKITRADIEDESCPIEVNGLWFQSEEISRDLTFIRRP